MWNSNKPVKLCDTLIFKNRTDRSTSAANKTKRAWIEETPSSTI